MRWPCASAPAGASPLDLAVRRGEATGWQSKSSTAFALPSGDKNWFRASTPPGVECLPGLYRGPSPRDRVHLAQKPVDLLALLCRIAPAGGTALDPFARSATTLACLSTSRASTGCEIDPVHFATAANDIDFGIRAAHGSVCNGLLAVACV